MDKGPLPPSWPFGSCSLDYFGWIPRASVLCLLSYFSLAWPLLSPGPHTIYPQLRALQPSHSTIPTGLTHPLVPSAASTPLHLGKTGLAWALGHLRTKSGEENWNGQPLGRNIYYEKYQRICVFTYFNYFWKNWTQVCFCALAYLYFILLRAKKK